MVSYIGLETLLKEKGIGKTELSSKLGLSTRTVAKIAKGEKLSKNTLKKIADALGVEMWELFTEKPTSNKPNSNTLVCPKCGAEFVLKENT